MGVTCTSVVLDLLSSFPISEEILFPSLWVGQEVVRAVQVRGGQEHLVTGGKEIPKAIILAPPSSPLQLLSSWTPTTKAEGQVFTFPGCTWEDRTITGLVWDSGPRQSSDWEKLGGTGLSSEHPQRAGSCLLQGLTGDRTGDTVCRF